MELEPAQPGVGSDRDPRRTPAILVFLVCGTVLGAVLFARLRLLGAPLERDEGEYGYIAQLMLRGIPPFAEAYTMKLPGVPAVYALAMWLLGETATAIRIGLLAANALSALMVYALGRHLLGRRQAVMAATMYAALSLSPTVCGQAAHATQFLTLGALAALLVIVGGSQAWRALAAGVLLGLAVLAKQHGLAFALLGCLLIAVRPRSGVGGGRLRNVGLLGLGLALVLGGLGAALALAGTFQSFWFWTATYARAYIGEVSLGQAVVRAIAQLRDLVRAATPVWACAAAGAAFVTTPRVSRWAAVVVVGLALAGAVAAVPGFYFRPHYFVPLLPGVALLGAIGADALVTAMERLGCWGRALSMALLGIVVASPLIHDARALFLASPEDFVRTYYRSNPFVEAAEIGRYLRAHTQPEDRIAVLGSEPEILFYARRRSATKYLYTYPLFEHQPYAGRMQREMTREVRAARPAYVVWVGGAVSWAHHFPDASHVYVWFKRYRASTLERVGMVDMLPSGYGRVRWGLASRGDDRNAHYSIEVLRRRDPPVDAQSQEGAPSVLSDVRRPSIVASEGEE